MAFPGSHHFPLCEGGFENGPVWKWTGSGPGPAGHVQAAWGCVHGGEVPVHVYPVRLRLPLLPAWDRLSKGLQSAEAGQ